MIDRRLALVLALSMPLVAQQVVVGDEDYVAPPTEITNVLSVLHERESLSNVNSTGTHFLVPKSMGMASLASLARPYVNLGETPLDHRANRSRSLSMGTTVGYDLVEWKTGKRTAASVPNGMTVSGGKWSPDGRHLAFIGNDDDGSYLFIADVATGESRRACEQALNATLVSSFHWSGDSKTLVAVLIPAGRGPIPQRDAVANEPQVWVTKEGKTPSRTYRFLLKSPYDKTLLEYLTTGQLSRIDVASGEVTPVGQPAMISRVDTSPGGDHFRVTTMRKPFSYFVPRSAFGSKEELWDKSGKVLLEISERKLREGPRARPTPPTPPRRRGGAPAPAAPKPPSADDKNPLRNKRNLTWRPDGEGFSFLMREPAPKKPEKKKDDGKKPAGKGDGKKPAGKGDGKKPAGKGDGKKPAGKGDGKKSAGKGDGKKPAGKGAKSDAKSKAPEKPRKDRVMQWLPPFDEKSMKVIWESDVPINSVRYSSDCQTLYISIVDQKTMVRHLFAVSLSDPKKRLTIHKTKPKDAKDAKAAAASPPATRRRGRRRGRGGRSAGLMTRPGPMGPSVVRTSSDGKFVYRSGSDDPKDPKKESPAAWIDKVEVSTGKSTRVWKGNGKGMQESIAAVLDDDLAHVVVSRQSNTDVPNSFLKNLGEKSEKQLTKNTDPAPKVTRAKRERIQVTRVDGFKFWVNVTIPCDYGQKLPALFWFYPREFTSQKQYDDRQRPTIPNRFPTMRSTSKELLTLLGYVLVQPDCPIVGAEGRMNDNFVADLRNSLWAVIDELDKRQIIDRNRLAIGGHSYGAFGTANALAHTPFFKAGIAGDGNYNRSLTPMSFQAERRYIWDARETYLRMSPLLWANQVNGALLMYHGMDDNNTGTFPIHSPRMFQALNGLGKPAAMYMYPYEGHGPRAKETIHDLWARWVHWLDIHVKNPERAKEMYKKAKRASGVEGNGK